MSRLKIKLSELVKPLNGRLIGADVEFSRINTDTRQLEEGDLFVALKGDNFNGADYCEKAQSLGAIAVLSEVEQAGLSIPQLIVDDAVLALGKMAAYKRQRISAPIVAITGSCGKTSVKAFLKEILSNAGKTCATQGNFNNHIGVPLTLMAADGDEDFLVVEAGTSNHGEIAYLSEIIDPDVAVVTNVFPAHLDGLGSVDLVAKEKANIYSAGARRVIPVVNRRLCHYAEIAKVAQQAGAYLFSSEAELIPAEESAESGPRVQAHNVQMDAQGFARFELETKREGKNISERFAVTLAVPGEHQVDNALAASACALALNVAMETILKGLSEYQGDKGRMHIVELTQGRLVDDSYNANPGSMAAAVDFLSHCDDAILVLGDMGELGDYANQAHADIGRYAKEKNIRALMVHGRHSSDYLNGFGKGAEAFADHATLAQHVLNAMNDTTTVLVKGSRSSHMDRVSKAIIEAKGA